MNYIFEKFKYLKVTAWRFRQHLPEKCVLMLMPLWINSRHAIPVFWWLRRRLGFLFMPTQLVSVVRTIRASSRCNLAVFGVGHDTLIWKFANRSGRCVFFEHSKDWAGKTLARLGRLEIYIVDYGTRVDDWRKWMANPDPLGLPLPDNVADTSWDVVIVDGPPGGRGIDPGRMRSIVTARSMVAPSGHIFVDDCDRTVEQEFCRVYLGEENLVDAIFDRTLMKHYQFNNR
ncbi:MAG: hypothetical protein AAF402_00500 [Pseudomonadota bacterium]